MKKERLPDVAQIILLFSFLFGVFHDVMASEKEAIPLLQGEQMPNAFIQNEEGQMVELQNICHEKACLIVFVEGAWSPYAQVQLNNLRKYHDYISNRQIELLVITADRLDKAKQLKKRTSLQARIFSDVQLSATVGFGVTKKLSPEERENEFEAYGISIEEETGRAHNVLPLPSYYLVDKKGIIRFMNVELDATRRLKTNILKAVIEETEV